jgi:UDP-2-acetamido-3-amino-2,3-dideoxy-glucuronate N-acetyltransferase
MANARIHPTTDVHAGAKLGDGVSVWQSAQVRDRAVIGDRTIVGMGTYIDIDVTVGKDCKFQNYVCTYAGVTIEDGVFCGPCVVFTNDLYPRAINADGSIKSATDWTMTKTLIRYGAALGANCTIVCGSTVGRWALVAAGSVVSKDVPDYALVAGNPARVRGFISPAGNKLELPAGADTSGNTVELACSKTADKFAVDGPAYREFAARARK